MGKPKGFLEHSRREAGHRPVEQRMGDYFEVDLPLEPAVLQQQAARCMDCGIPFCHGTGCPVANRIPEFNDFVYQGRWEEACALLHATNNFPEITGRICPALCEASCTLSINDEPVLIRQIELQIVERGFEEGWITPLDPPSPTGKRVAIVGSGPAGLAAAQQLARSGHEAVVFERDNRIGGLLRYGIPDFKLDKKILDRRIEQLRAEGVRFETEVAVGEDISERYLRSRFDAICLTMGARQPRDLSVSGRGLENVHFALDYLIQQNRINAGDELPSEEDRITASGKIVAVIGGGDTGSDCVGTAGRQGAKEVHLFEILPKPPEKENPQTPWPLWPRILRTTTSHEEGCERRWCVKTTQLSGAGIRVDKLHGIEVEWQATADGYAPKDVAGSEFVLKVDLVLLAMGFTHVEHRGLLDAFGLDLDERGNIRTDENYQTSVPGVFAAGDASQGASLVVRAVQAGRQAAAAIDQWLSSSPERSK